MTEILMGGTSDEFQQMQATVVKSGYDFFDQGQ